MKRSIRSLVLVLSWSLGGHAFSADAATTPVPPTVTVNGLVDTYYTYNFTNSASKVSGLGNNGIFFNTVDDSFALGLAEGILNVTQGQVGGKLVLAYGQEGNLGLLGSGLDVLQAYVSYNPDQWSFKLGRMVTHMGNEVIESKANWNYSRSLLFWYTIPLWHTGLCVTYAPDAKFSVMGAVYNGWNLATATTYGKTYGLQFAVKPGSDLSLTLNGIAGPNPSGGTADLRYLGEGIISWNATDKLSLVLDGDVGGQDIGTTGSVSFWGLALYGRYQLQSDWAATLRLEALEDGQNLMAVYGAAPMGPATDVEGREATLTVEYNFTANLLGRFEGRWDTALSGGKVYAAGSGPFGGASADQMTGTASAILSF